MFRQLCQTFEQFAKAVLLLLLWLSLPICCWLMTFGVQVAEPLLRTPGSSSSGQPVGYMFVRMDSSSLKLYPVTPQRLSVDPLETSNVLTVQLSPYHVVSGVTSLPQTYAVLFNVPGDLLSVADELGKPIIQPITLTISDAQSAPSARFQLRPNKADFLNSQIATIYLELLDESGTRLVPNSLPLDVNIEPGWQTALFRLGKLSAGWVAVLAALITAVVGFGVQQWKQLAEEEVAEKRKLCEDAMKEIENLETRLKNRPSEAARDYLKFSDNRNYPWTERQIRMRLQEAWKKNATAQLQDVVELLREDDQFAIWIKLKLVVRTVRTIKQLTSIPRHTYLEMVLVEKAKTFRLERTIQALEWAWGILDDEWRQKSLDALRLLMPTLALEEEDKKKINGWLHERQWSHVFRPWPHLSLWRGFSPITDSLVQKGIEILEIRGNPFGSLQAESDVVLFQHWVELPWLEDLRRTQPALVEGCAGSGKTALALILAYNGLAGLKFFPVYCPVVPEKVTLQSQLDVVIRALATTLLHFLAANPASFLRASVVEQAAIAELFIRYIATGANLVLRFRQAGLPHTDDAQTMLEELDHLTDKTSLTASPADEELIALIGNARPAGFPCTAIMWDVQSDTEKNDATVQTAYLRSVLDLMDRLARVGVFVKAFLPDTGSLDCLQAQLPLKPVHIIWAEEELETLLQHRLQWCGSKSIVDWCDPGAKFSNPDQRLIAAANGTPGQLIAMGNKLLKKIGKEQHRLNAQDLDDILGAGHPIPTQVEK